MRSGNSAFLGSSTPVGARYGSSQGHPYVNLRTAAGGKPSTTTLTFDHPTPANKWAFVLGDVDADTIKVSARGADGKALTTGQLGWKGAFNYCVNTPKPSTCTGSGPFTDKPVWNSGRATLVGRGGDTSGASGWFQPTVPITRLTLVFSVQTGIPIYQLWTVAHDSPVITDPDPLIEVTEPGVKEELVVPPGPGRSKDPHIRVVDPPRHGRLRVTGGNTLVYKPDEGFVGTDCYRYSHVDTSSRTHLTEVCVRVRPALADTGSTSLPALPLGAGLVALGFTVRTVARRIGLRR
ncbi:Ig-like domain-containing protein [Streptacidiphilus sp. N1-10]|uniref:Ig-like domain-containing protein n=1 Tax=Streptacidiphilus jeojiensis TaxID=3229225 RepID=A0ABV6XGV4_9ACTN